MSLSPTFTAAQIAAALGASPRAARRALAMIPAEGARMVQGNETAAWTLAMLPASMAAKLMRRAKAQGYRNAEQLLSEPARRFVSPVLVNQLAGPVQARAIKLRDALRLPLDEQAKGLKGAALDDLGLREYERVLGHPITARRWRDILNRTLARDNGEEQWNRLDLYLDARPHVARGTKVEKTSQELRDAEKILLDYASQVREPSAPTPEEKAMLLNTAFEQTGQLVQDGMNQSAARRAMRRALWTCGVTMARTETALAEQWRVKEATWREAGESYGALKDRRPEASGNHRQPEIPQDDIDLVIAHAIKYGGRVSQSWRYAVENDLLSRSVRLYYSGLRFASKSYVPRVIREAARHEVRLLRDIHHGPRTAELNGAYITRDWTKEAAGDWYQADDVTLNNYYYAPDDKGRLSLMRGQVLLMIDVRSTCIIQFAILDQRNYTSHTIRTLITKTCDAHGLPRKGFYFERGIWANSKLLKGDAKASENDVTMLESERGLFELGLKFTHSRRPRSKPVERVIGQLQNLLDGEPGDAGRAEITDKFERLQERKRLVESGHAPANDYFYSYDQWTERLTRFCEEYNNARNDGAMTRGLTPFQAWKHYLTDPLVKLPPEARYLLADHKRPVVVGRNGITLRFGKKNFVYRNARTGKLRGQRVLAWFNPELPDLLSVTDMNRENCFVVERAEEVPAMDATSEELHRAMESINAHNGYARHRYRTLAKIADLNARPTIMDYDTAKLGSEMADQKQQFLDARQVREKRVKAGRTVIDDLGLAFRPGDDLPQERVDAAQRIKQRMEKFSKEPTV